MDKNKPGCSKYFQSSSGKVDSTIDKKDKDDEIDFDDEINDEELNEIFTQNSLNKKLKLLAEERINAVQTQPMDFTLIKEKNFAQLKNSNIILVNTNQLGNELLKKFKFVRYIMTDTISPAHYVIYNNCCALFLSLKYHMSKPEYIYEEISKLKNKYQISLLIVLLDHLIYEELFKEITVLSIRTNFTVLPCWSYEEAAQHIEHFRKNIDKSPEMIMGRNVNSNINHQNSIEALTQINSINRIDGQTLLATFETMGKLLYASLDEISLCPGISMTKAKRMQRVFDNFKNE